MNQFDRVFISILFFILVCLCAFSFIDLGEEHKNLEKKIDLILEIQRKTIDVEIKEVKILQEILKEKK